MRFLYFLPGLTQVDRGVHLRDAGLLYAFSDAKLKQRRCNEGPGGQGGMVCVPGDPPEEIGYFPDRQVWAKSIKGDWWLGYEKAAPPQPADLKRETAIGFAQGRLGDGNRWLLPTAILANGESPLPKVRKLNEDGTITRRVCKEYEQLYLYADQVRDAIKNQAPLTDQDEWNICIEALRVNYRLGPDEVNALGLLTDDAITVIFSVLLDRMHWPETEAAIANLKGE